MAIKGIIAFGIGGGNTIGYLISNGFTNEIPVPPTPPTPTPINNGGSLMNYYIHLLNLPNQNTATGNALNDTQLGIIKINELDSTKINSSAILCSLLNSNSGSSNGDLTDNSEGINPVKTEYASPVLQISLQNPALSRAYPPRNSIPVF